MPRNPLISLDSDERFQGNPTLIIGAFAPKQPPTKKTQTDRPDPASVVYLREAAKVDSSPDSIALNGRRVRGAGIGVDGDPRRGSSSSIRPRGGAARSPWRAPGPSPPADRPRPRGRPTI